MSENTEDTAITAEEFDKLSMSEHFDETNTYEQKVKPLLDQIHEICMENKIPFFAAACIENDDTKCKIVQSVHFNGPERTPTQMVAAQQTVLRTNRHGAAAILHTIDQIENFERVMSGAISGKPN